MTCLLTIAGVLTLLLAYAREFVQGQITYYSAEFLKDEANMEIVKKAAHYIDMAKLIMASNFCVYLFWTVVFCFVISKILTWT